MLVPTIQAIAPLMIRRAKAWSGREGLNIRRVLLPKDRNSVISTKFIDL